MKVINKRAKFDYDLSDRFEAGIVLNGGEAKAFRLGRVSLAQTYAKIVGGEVWLVNANIPVEGKKDYTPTRSRKLLLHRPQISSIEAKIKGQKLTLVPLSMYTKGRLAKVELALGKAKRQYQKKEQMKKADIKRELERYLRG